MFLIFLMLELKLLLLPIRMTKRDGLFFEMYWALWEIVRVFKAVTSYEIRRAEGQPWFAWQEEYYDSVIRTEAALQEIRRYILENPVRWSQDKLYRRY